MCIAATTFLVQSFVENGEAGEVHHVMCGFICLKICSFGLYWVCVVTTQQV